MHRRLTGIAALILFILTLAVYTPALNNDFVWDDTQYVYENTMVHSLSAHSLYQMSTTFHESNWHPLTWVSHAIDCALWGLNPFGHHLTNIILHGLNTLLVFFLIIQLVLKATEVTPTPFSPTPPRSVAEKPLLVAGITAVLCAIHPLRVESVVWVAERKDLLCAFFFLLTIFSYLAYTASSVTRHRLILYALSLLLCALALLSKPMAVTLPVTLLLLDIYPLKRISLHSARKLSFVTEKVPFFTLSAVSSVITIIAQRAGGALIPIEQLQFSARLLNALRSIVFYLEKLLVPFNLVPFYPFPATIHWRDPPYLISLVLVLAVTGICVWRLRQGKYLLFIAWSYFVITLLPTLGIIQVGGQAAADRYTYLPGLSIFVVAGAGVVWVLEKGRLLKLKVVSGGILLACIFSSVFLGQLTVTQTGVWHNSESLWSYVLEAFPFPRSYSSAHYNIGNVYFEKGDLDRAVFEYTRALTLYPDYADAHNNLGAAYFRKGMPDEAISECKKAIALNPRFARAHNNLGNAYFKKGSLGEAISAYKKSLELHSGYAETYNNLGFAYFKSGKVDDAIAEYTRALALRPDYAEVHVNLGMAYRSEGRLDDAIFEYKKSLVVKPRYAKAHYNLSLAYYYKKHYRLAIIHCDKARELGYSVNPRLLELLTPYR